MNESLIGSDSEFTSSGESKLKLYALSEVIEKDLILEGHTRKVLQKNGDCFTYIYITLKELHIPL